jgi:hypothetical protein
MGVKTRDDIKNKIVKAIDNRSDLVDGSWDTEITDHINHTYLHMTHPVVYMHEDLMETVDISLVGLQTTYDLTVAFPNQRVLGLRSVSYLASATPDYTTRRRRLRPKPIQWYDGQTHHPTSEPAHYVPNEKQTLILSPTPATSINNHTLRVRVWLEANQLALGTDTTAVADYFDEVLYQGALALTEKLLGYEDRAAASLETYSQMINNLQSKDVVEGQSWGLETQLSSVPYMEST